MSSEFARQWHATFRCSGSVGPKISPFSRTQSNSWRIICVTGCDMVARSGISRVETDIQSHERMDDRIIPITAIGWRVWEAVRSLQHCFYCKVVRDAPSVTHPLLENSNQSSHFKFPYQLHTS